MLLSPKIYLWTYQEPYCKGETYQLRGTDKQTSCYLSLKFINKVFLQEEKLHEEELEYKRSGNGTTIIGEGNNHFNPISGGL